MRLLVLAALLAVPARAETNREHLEKQAGAVWDADHAPDPGRALEPEQTAFLDHIEALARVKKLSRKAVAAALKMKLEFTNTTNEDEAKYFSSFDAYPSSGSAVTHVDLRVGVEKNPTGLVVVTIDQSLGIGPWDVKKRFGEKFSVSPPSIHAPADEPYYYVYERADGKLSLGIRPGPKPVLVDVVWNTDKRD